MHLELPGNAMSDICDRGGFGIVSKYEYRGREFAVKTLRPRGLSSQEMSNVGHLWAYTPARVSGSEYRCRGFGRKS